MDVLDAVEARIQQGIRDIFTLKEYPRFLAFASNFASFSYKNIIMIYMQAPDAKYVAGLFAWKQITDDDIPPETVPILILYPEYDEKAGTFEYAIRKVFDYKNVGSLAGNDSKLKQLTRRCDTDSVYGFFRKIFKEQTGMSVYPTDDDLKGVEASGNTLLISERNSDKEKFQLLLDYYLNKGKRDDDSPVIFGCVSNTVKYIVYSYYGFEEAGRITFPYIALPVIDDAARSQILQRSLGIASNVIDCIDTAYHERMRAKNREEER